MKSLKADRVVVLQATLAYNVTKDRVLSGNYESFLDGTATSTKIYKTKDGEKYVRVPLPARPRRGAKR